MLKQFQNYLISKGYRTFSINNSPSTVIDYAWRIDKICSREGITLDKLAENIQKYLEEYSCVGEKWNIGKKSHESYINALRQFKKFVLSEGVAA